MSQCRKYFRVFKELVRIRFHKLMLFRLDFFGPFFVDGSLFLAQLLAFKAVYANVDKVGSWGKGEMIIYIGTFSLLNAVSMAICFFGILGIPGKIRSGEMDLYLTKPISPLFRITFENISPGSIPLIAMSILIIRYGIDIADVPLNPMKCLTYGFWLILMEILYYLMEILIRSVSFFLVSATRLDQLEEAGLTLCMKLPGIVFYGGYKVIFYVILPYGIMATFPVQSLMGDLTWQMAGHGIGIVVVFSIVTAKIWSLGIGKYNSASS